MEEQYAPVYRHHLRKLQQFKAVSDNIQVVTQICGWIYQDGRFVVSVLLFMECI